MAIKKVAGNDGKTYGVGPAAEKMNRGPATSTESVLQADGSVKVDGKVVYDPAKDGLELRQDDPDIDYAAGVGIVADKD